MSAEEQVAKLEALLSRVNVRRNQPRQSAPSADEQVRVAEAAPQPTAPKAAPSGSKLPEAAATPRPTAVAPAAAAPTPPAATAAHAAPPRAAAPAPAPAAAPSAVVAAPPPAAVAPVAPPRPAAPAPVPVVAAPAAAPAIIVPKPPPTPEPTGSDVDVLLEEGVAEVDLEGLEEEEAAMSLRDSVADLDTVDRGAPGAGAKDDEPPASSRRPIQIPQPPLADLAFGQAAETKTPHPAPPESGRQVAIPPVESGSDFEADLLKSGVRAAPAIPTSRAEVAPAKPAAAEEARAEITKPVVPIAAAELKAEVTRPELPVASPAAFHGAVPVPSPSTFGDLLDSTLSL